MRILPNRLTKASARRHFATGRLRRYVCAVRPASDASAVCHVEEEMDQLQRGPRTTRCREIWGRPRGLFRYSLDLERVARVSQSPFLQTNSCRIKLQPEDTLRIDVSSSNVKGEGEGHVSDLL
eukprot:Gb_15685 [translate_table: standard]